MAGRGFFEPDQLLQIAAGAVFKICPKEAEIRHLQIPRELKSIILEQKPERMGPWIWREWCFPRDCHLLSCLDQSVPPPAKPPSDFAIPCHTPPLPPHIVEVVTIEDSPPASPRYNPPPLSPLPPHIVEVVTIEDSPPASPDYSPPQLITIPDSPAPSDTSELVMDIRGSPSPTHLLLN